MTMLPRNMISPIVSPSARHLGQRRRVEHRHAFLERVAHALAAVQPRLLGERLVLPRRPLHRHRRRPVDLGQAVDVGDVEADPRHALDHRRRRRRAGDHRPHLLRDAGAQLGRRGDQQVVDDRRGAVVVDALVAHRGEDRRRLDLAQADVGAAEHRHRPREAPAVAVEHRQRPQVAREVRHGPGRRVADRVQVGAAVVGDDALRVAGRARGVRDGDRVPLVGRPVERRQRRVRGEQRLVLVRAEPVAGAGVFAVADVDDDRPCGRASRAGCAAPAPIVGASSRSVISTSHSQWFSCQAMQRARRGGC